MLNKYKIVGDTLIVYNRKDNKEMLFDAEDLNKVSKYTWSICKTEGYVRHSNKGITTLAHRLIVDAPTGKEVDHESGNRLDNRKSNLRIATHKMNSHNRIKTKGYSWDKQSKKWRARIRANGKLFSLGLYNNEDDARAAYLEAKRKYHPTAPHHLYF